MSAPDSVSYDKRVTPVGLLTAICDRHNHKYCMASCSVHVTAPQDSEVLDLTSSQLPSLDGILVPPGLKTLDLTANRLTVLEPQLLSLQGLTSLCLRQNLLPSAFELQTLQAASALQELSLYDNQLQVLPHLASYTALIHLDISYNQLTDLRPLSALQTSSLRELYAASNNLSATQGLSHLTSLTLLELGCNRLRSLEAVESLSNLQQLWLGDNRLCASPCFARWPQLQKLSLQSNRYTAVQGIGECTALQELWLSHNGMTEIQGLSQLSRLTALDICSNQMTVLDELTSLTGLVDLWANENRLASLAAIVDALTASKNSLTCVSFAENPLASETGYKAVVMQLLPHLQEFDTTYL